MSVRLVARLRLIASAIAAVGLLVLAQPGPARAQGAGFIQHNLVSDLSGVADHTDTNLVNSWGLAHSPTGPWMVSDNGTGLATQYDSTGAGVPPVITIPPPAGSPAGTTAAPTGTVFNGTSDFVVTEGSNSGPSQFLCATEDGTISGWNPDVDPTHAILEVDRSTTKQGRFVGAVYKGLAMGHNSSGNFLFATNFRFGTVEQFDAHFNLVNSFTDKPLTHDCPVRGSPTQCFAPFGIQNIGGILFVTFALQNAERHDDVSGAGNGFVDEFDTNGNLMHRFASNGTLNSPWGLALAPSNFGGFGGDLLVGDFGDGRINAFDLSGNFIGQLANANGELLLINGLWGLAFGNGGDAGPTTTLFFASGLNDEADGLFGSITPA